MDEAIFVGGGGAGHADPQHLLARYANRHGLIAGATGTGKTVTLQILAEGFSALGVPVFLSDVKGDLSGLARPGSATGKLHDAFTARARTIGLDDYRYDGFPVTFWDLFGRNGHPLRTTLAEMGPLLLSRLLDLTETQEGVLNIVFRLADEEGMPLLDLRDLQALLTFAGERRADLSLRYGNVSVASIGAIQRRLLVLDGEGGAGIFGEPALELADILRLAPDCRGRISILDAGALMAAPRLYATFLLWLLSELFEDLPEVGDPDRPKLMLFFDEAHLLFDGAPKALLDKVEQVVRLIRSKGVGIYFVTQMPDDVPRDILGQLGNRVQHALRAFTARDRKALAEAAETYRDNPAFDTETAIREVGTGEAVTSFLVEKGAPGMVERTLIRPPASQLGPISEAERQAVIADSPVAGKYAAVRDRESAHEMLKIRAELAARQAERAEAVEGSAPGRARRYSAPGPRRGGAEGLGAAMVQAVVKELGGTTGRRLVRGILGSLFKGR